MAGDEHTRTRALGVAIAAVIATVLVIVTVSLRDDRPADPDAAGSAVGKVSPLTGESGPPGRAVLAVKVDNSPEARPWTGVGDADVVYLEPVEGGLTRLLAVFASRLPPSVGPVRSVRESDLDVLAAYGRPALAFSGNAPQLDAAISAASIVPVSAERVAGAYHRAGDHPAPHNLYGDPAALVRAAHGVSGPHDVGFRFGALAGPSTAAADVTERVGRTEVAAHWNGTRWDLTVGGAPTDAHPATVVVQHVGVRTSAIRDVAGSPSPTAVTVGSGAAQVWRDGKRVTGSWSRPAPNAPTVFTATDGRPMTFAPGPVWVLLAGNG